MDGFGEFEATLAMAGVRDDLLTPSERTAFDHDGYLILRDAIPHDWIEPLRESFEQLIPERWHFPREPGTRFSKLDGEPLVRRTCLLPRVLAAVASMMRRRFYFAAIQGRDPALGGGSQKLHRDWLVNRTPTTVISGFAFLDDFDAGNGATRVQPGTHRDAPPTDDLVLSGRTGDILLLDAHLLHCGTRNESGRKRRSLHMGFNAHEKFGQDYDVLDLTGTSLLERRLMGHDA
ncbi:MAG TPA: phytanoyl-CoA dioxygenase family protein [Rhizomicrobium sp.]|nr:phytanoyl-CoA dioxygenase family protein [Rhizomicrobium sp.]